MNELKILGVDANVYFKNIEHYIKNPRRTHFRIFNNTIKLNKDEYVDTNTTMGKEAMNDYFLKFTNATRVVINDTISATHIMKRSDGSKNLSENLDMNDFKPMLDNYVLILPWLGNLFHIHGYWFQKGTDKTGEKNTRVSSFVVHNNKLSFFPVDWFFHTNESLQTDIIKEQLIKSFTSHNNNIKHESGKIDIEKVLPFYIQNTTPAPNFILRHPKMYRKDYQRAINRVIHRLSYNHITLLPMYIMHIVRNINNQYQREEIKYFDYRDEAIKRNETDTPFYSYRIVDLNKKILTTTRYERSVNTNKYHEVIGFWRNYKSGKRVWINSQWRGDISRGIIEKDYVT